MLFGVRALLRSWVRDQISWRGCAGCVGRAGWSSGLFRGRSRPPRPKVHAFASADAGRIAVAARLFPKCEGLARETSLREQSTPQPISRPLAARLEDHWATPRDLPLGKGECGQYRFTGHTKCIGQKHRLFHRSKSAIMQGCKKPSFLINFDANVFQRNFSWTEL